MPTPSHAQKLAWMAQWRSAAVALAKVRAEELAHADLARVASDLDDASVQAARARGQSTTSGLIAQQQLFGRALQP